MREKNQVNDAGAGLLTVIIEVDEMREKGESANVTLKKHKNGDV